MTTALRREVAFLSDGVTCRAWAYVPDAAVPRPLPCIVMAHGLSGTRNASLEPYAERFAAAGFYVVLFDYRYLGDSDGEPRQLISIPRQLEDWKSAIAFARGDARRRSGAHRLVGLLAVGWPRRRRRRARQTHRRHIGAVPDARRTCERAQGSQAGRIRRTSRASPRRLSMTACAPRSGCRHTTCRSWRRRASLRPCRRPTRTLG